jgi:hypothetical protein
MPVLHLDNVPEELYRRIECLAAAEQVPVTEETLRLLQEAEERKPAEQLTGRSQREILDWIIRNRFTPAPGTPDSVELLREDRNR